MPSTTLKAMAICMSAHACWGTPAAWQEQAVPPGRRADHVAVMEIEGPIDSITKQALQRMTSEAVEEGADLIVLELDTPGGDLEATLEICNFIKQETGIRTRAWVRPEAYSAGAIIALATEGVIMAPGGRMGDAAPIRGVPVAGMLQMPATERAKIEAPVLAEVVDSARRNGYDEKLVQSMVSVRFALWELEAVDGSRRIFVDANEYKRIFGSAPPIDLGRGESPSVPSEEPPLAGETRQEVTLLQDITSERPRLGPEDADQWRLRGQVIGEEGLLVANETDALRMGLSNATIADDDELKRHFGASRLVRHRENWIESTTRFLTSWPIQAILIGIVVIGFLIEIAAPGTSIFGGAALLALALLVGAPMLVGLGEWWDVMLILGGLTLVGVEIVLMPGVGIAGIIGTTSLMVGLVGVMVTADMGTPEANNQITIGVLAVIASLLLGGTGAWWFSRRSGGFWLFNRLVLDTQTGTTTDAPDKADTPSANTGDIGHAATNLRPGGRIEIENTLHAARSTTGWIDAGTRVRVLREFGGELEVEPIEDVPSEGPARKETR
ncbi:MAG: hypothetical protein MK082_07670 [Phycisphaerales bacterium]|nr:hypothetical protein [Phycisphaerales bacterium]